jgi:hypothetical protein
MNWSVSSRRPKRRELAHVHGTKLRIREKIENILHAPESVGIKNEIALQTGHTSHGTDYE